MNRGPRSTEVGGLQKSCFDDHSKEKDRTNDNEPSLEKTEVLSREQVKAGREAKKLAKLMSKTMKLTTAANDSHAVNCDGGAKGKDNNSGSIAVAGRSSQKKVTLSKAERRAIQEAQRAAKAEILPGKSKCASAPVAGLLDKATVEKKLDFSTVNPYDKISSNAQSCSIKLFNHLENIRKDVNLFVHNTQIHPSVVRLGEQFAQRTIVGSNARCIGFLKCLQSVIQDFETPPRKEFIRSLDTNIKKCVEHLNKCRPLAVSVSNAYKHIKHILTQLSHDQAETELKECLCHFIETYLENQIGKAAQAISCSMQQKICDGDVILTFGCSSVIYYIFDEAHRRNVNFNVIIVDALPFCEGREMLRRLCVNGISCSYVLINAVSFVMPNVTKTLLGAHALLSNGHVLSRAGTAQVALVARSFNVPVLVCCETHKFSERFQTDAIVYNELGNPDELIINDKCCLSNWHTKQNMTPLNLNYDLTPPELITAVFTEVSILPCTSVPVILRIKPTEIGYYN